MPTYTNPVYSGYFADSFVWQHEGIYCAIGIGTAEAEGEVEVQPRVFLLLRSENLATWESAGSEQRIK